MARSSLRYALALAASLILAGCGGGSSNSTGPTDVPQEPVKTATPAPAPKPEPPPRQFQMGAFVGGTGMPGTGGCVSIQADSPPNDTACDSRSFTAGDEGTRGTVTAAPNPGYRFIRWASYSSDCGGESVNPCSFAFDRNKQMIAVFGR
jgi:Divergent InlB B-repeat domain